MATTKKATKKVATTKASTTSKKSNTADTKKASTGTKKSPTKETKKASTDSKKATTTAKKIAPKKDAAKNLDDLFLDGIKDLYWAEKALSKELPKMHKNATSDNLKKAIEGHIKETATHITRLEKCFSELGKKVQGVKCDAMAGLLEEGKGIIEDTKPGAVRDAGIIAAAQKVEHYEIASYGTLAAFAKVLGHKGCLKELLATLEEEKKCNDKLTSIADTDLNSEAIK